MTQNITKFEKKLRKVSKQRPKSLILNIPSTIRDLMEFEAETTVSLQVCVSEDGEKYLKIQKIDD